MFDAGKKKVRKTAQEGEETFEDKLPDKDDEFDGPEDPDLEAFVNEEMNKQMKKMASG